MTGSTPTSHYIVMVQTNPSPSSRSYSDYDSLYACMEGITKIYDDFLKEMYPQEEEMVYDFASLIQFVTKLTDLSCLVYNRKSNMYRPQGKEWIMQELYKHLLKSKESDD